MPALALTLAIVSFVCALIFTPLTRDLLRRWNLVDLPGGRKIHDNPIPRFGGIAIAASIAVAVAITAVLGLWSTLASNLGVQLLVRLIPAASIILIVGVVDDMFTLKPWQKLVGQCIGVGLAYANGVRIDGIAGYSTAWLTFPVTVGWLLLCTNAFNLIDGVDGLATGAGLFSTSTILLAGILEKNNTLVLAAVPVGAALIGFLRYNFSPATIFLGDSGSLLVGFILGCFGVIWNFKAATVFGMIAPAMAMVVPLLDLTLSVARRFLRGQPIFGADRRHLHHRLLDRGITPRRVVLMLYGICAFGALLSLLQTIQRNRYSNLVVLLCCAGTWIALQRLGVGYHEFGVAGKMFVSGAIQRMVNTDVQLREFESALDACTTLDGCWEQICKQCRSFGFASVEWNIGGRIVEERFARGEANCWSVIVPLDEGASLHLSVPPNAPHASPMIMSLANVIARKLPERTRTLQFDPAGVEALRKVEF